ncbi:hypothetical protein Kpho01_51420 [Kitasatospora phosalacinea]|uniref:Uncharacterized protein n=1 Tax=Kitasatospora phosalacinea TaxID=2065 RepID=A0A9W6UP43_9ACTN|nr:hypothetical protein Kpho01_51420 [Kitasatospora phosalacinea]
MPDGQPLSATGHYVLAHEWPTDREGWWAARDTEGRCAPLLGELPCGRPRFGAPLVRPVAPRGTPDPGHTPLLYGTAYSPLSRALVHSAISAYRASPPRLVGR